MPSNTHTIDIKVKPYVRQYLINNCGNPVDLTYLPKFKKLFSRLLYKPLFPNPSLPLTDGECYVRIIISDDTFGRFGFDMETKNMRYFNTEIEKDIKFIMRNYIATFAVFYNIATCIRKFQERFNFPEDVWGYDAIKKDIDRKTEVKRSKEVLAFVNMMDNNLHQLFMDNLSAVGTISKKLKHELSEI